MIRRFSPLFVLTALVACAGPPDTGSGPGLGPEADTRQWNYGHQGEQARLAYGTPDSDDVPLLFSCRNGSGEVEVSRDNQRPGSPITLASGPVTAILRGQEQADLANDGGTVIVAARAPVDLPVLVSFRRTGRLALVEREGRADLPATVQEQVLIEQFFAACSG